MNVLEAAEKRLRYILNEFDQVYLSVSGGKDSGVMACLADKVATEQSATFDLFILDIEANYKKTAEYLEYLKGLSAVRDVYHFCLPFYEDNCTSVFQPQWMMWNPEEREKWIREIPKDAITLKSLDSKLYSYYEKADGNPDKFMRYFQLWYQQQYAHQKIACGIGIRAQESMQRYNAVTKGTYKYKGHNWTNTVNEYITKFYPLYDWSVEDIWGAIALYDYQYNQVYERMYKLGEKLHNMRICQPFGLQQRKGLEQFSKIEPETWGKLVNRVSGANFGSLYSKTSILGYNKTKKPPHMSWQEYTVFLLESLGLYSSGLRDHYYRKICILMNYYKKYFGMDIKDIQEEATRKQWQEDEKLWHNWKGIAKALEKNDFALSTRNYSLTKKDEEELYELARQYKNVLGLASLKEKQYKSIVEKIQMEERENDNTKNLSSTV